VACPKHRKTPRNISSISDSPCHLCNSLSMNALMLPCQMVMEDQVDEQALI
jgi:hypothetical protein